MAIIRADESGKGILKLTMIEINTEILKDLEEKIFPQNIS